MSSTYWYKIVLQRLPSNGRLSDSWEPGNLLPSLHCGRARIPLECLPPVCVTPSGGSNNTLRCALAPRIDGKMKTGTNMVDLWRYNSHYGAETCLSRRSYIVSLVTCSSYNNRSDVDDDDSKSHEASSPSIRKQA